MAMQDPEVSQLLSQSQIDAPTSFMKIELTQDQADIINHRLPKGFILKDPYRNNKSKKNSQKSTEKELQMLKNLPVKYKTTEGSSFLQDN